MPHREHEGKTRDQRIAEQLLRLRRHALALEQEHAADIEAAEPSFRASARNLVHYLGLRQHDIRSLQRELIDSGLSSFSTSEANTLAALDAVLARLDAAKLPAGAAAQVPVDFRTGPLLLRDHAQRLLGPPREQRSTRIMVTMPSEAATDAVLVRELLQAGMDVMRINCAHDGPEAWAAMVHNLRAAEADVAPGRRCRIQADLGGPKLRTGSIEALGRALHLKPERDPLGAVVKPVRVSLIAAVPGVIAQPGRLPVDSTLLAAARPGDRLVLHDGRGKWRELSLEADGEGLAAQTSKGVYLREDTTLELQRDGVALAHGSVGELPAIVMPILLRPGDELLLTRADLPGRDARRDAAGMVLEPARLHCTLEQAFRQVRAEERVWLDDGKIGGVVTASDGEIITLRITQASLQGSKLRAEKGINFPDSALKVPALTAKDLVDLAAVVPYADIVALSFVHTREDVLQLQDELQRLGARQAGIVLKIETREAFEHLPEILLASLRSPPVGVMVARGDLAVEIGFERLSEVQEEILWLCEAAHVPVVWATQMLEGLAKKGVPSRAEVTDAAASARAECAMLNKGPNMAETTRFLSDILGRMHTHQSKRRPTLRRLAVTKGF